MTSLNSALLRECSQLLEHAFIYAYIYIDVYPYVYIYMYVYVNTYMKIYINVNTLYIYICKYTHINK